MERPGTKEAAESILRELPSVVGAFVREDVSGQPREIHLLISPGPSPRAFSQDVRALLEERLGISIDQRIISIAQLAAQPTGGREARTSPLARRAAPATPARARFVSAESEVADGRVTVRVKLEWDDHGVVEADAVEVETGTGRVRAGALAALRAVTDVLHNNGRVELERAGTVRTLEREYAIVTALASSPFLGRRPLQLVGAQVVEHDVETAGALAALKSANRLVGWIARLGQVYAEPDSSG